MTQDERQELARVIGWRLKCARQWGGITLEGAADEVGVHRQTLASYEASVWHLTVPIFEQLCQLYGVSPSKLLRRVDAHWEREREGEPPGE